MLRRIPVAESYSYVHIYPEGGYVLITTDSPNPLWKYSLERVNQFFTEVLLLCNGVRTGEQIALELAERLEITIEEAKGNVQNVLETANWKGSLTFLDEPLLAESPFPVHGSREMPVPLHLHLEITSQCNFKCIHCYREAGPSEEHFLTLEKVIETLSYLAALGLKVVEITGGEPLLHPNILQIIDFCVQHFEVTSLLTNGYFFDAEFAQRIEPYLREKKLLVSISCNSYDQEFHERFSVKKGCWERAVNAFKLIDQFGGLSRFTMNVIPENMSHLEATADFAQKIGATSFSASTVMPFGRGAVIDWQSVSDEDLYNYETSFKRIINKYDNFMITFPEELMAKIKNNHCGAGQSSFALGSNGNLRPCINVDVDLFKMGNIYRDNLEDILKNNLFAVLDTMEAPNPAICSDCKYETFCRMCWYRGLIAAQYANNCPWFANSGLSKYLNLTKLREIAQESRLDQYHSIKNSQ